LYRVELFVGDKAVFNDADSDKLIRFSANLSTISLATIGAGNITRC
jgi:hypothetical protein